MNSLAACGRPPTQDTEYENHDHHDHGLYVSLHRLLKRVAAVCVISNRAVSENDALKKSQERNLNPNSAWFCSLLQP